MREETTTFSHYILHPLINTTYNPLFNHITKNTLTMNWKIIFLMNLILGILNLLMPNILNHTIGIFMIALGVWAIWFMKSTESNDEKELERARKSINDLDILDAIKSQKNERSI